MRGLKRKICEATACRPSPFFRPAAQRSPAEAPFFAGPMLQRQGKDDEKKDPLVEGLKTTADKLSEHEAFKAWYEPKLNALKLTLWDKASPADKAAMLSFLGLMAWFAQRLYPQGTGVKFGGFRDGSAQNVSFSPHTDSEMERCMASTMQKWRFPTFQGDPVAFEQPVNLVAK